MIKDKHIIKQSLVIANNAHLNQVDKAGIPYMYHIYGVWNRLTNWSRFIQALGIVHDVVEDSDWTVKDFETFNYDKNFIKALDAITKRKGEKYQDYIKRVIQDPSAKLVKQADLEDNLYRCKLYIEKHPNDPKNKSFQSMIIRYQNALLDVLYVPPGE